MYCRNCGAQINDDAKFCESCGASQTPNQPTTPEPIKQPPLAAQPVAPYTKQKKKRGCLTAFLIVAILSLVFVIAVANIPDQKIDEMASNLSVEESKEQLEKGEKNKQSNTTTTKPQKYTVNIVSSKVEKSNDSYYLVIQYDYTNNDTDAESFKDAFDVYIYQNGVQCLDYELWHDESERHQERAKVQPGTTYQVRQAYRLYDTTSPVEYEIKGGALFDTETYAKGTISLK